jgi:pyruvate dehydrogenase E1 component beta subunit
MSGATPARMVESLNSCLHRLLDEDPRLVLLGEDIADPYGGAFGVTRGLSTRHPDRVLSTPISEGAIVGVAGGLAMCGDSVVVEVMFGDFITLCFDPIVNFITKAVSMYGRPKSMRLVVRCPVGGNRGYGPTHSQSLQKHLLGVPHLRLYELSPLHPPGRVFDEMFGGSEPSVFFEDKVLYGLPPVTSGGLFDVESAGDDHNWAGARVDDSDPDWAVIAPGGLVPRVLPAIRDALVEGEVVTELLVPSRLFPLDLAPIVERLARAGRVLIVEDGVAGGSWSSEICSRLYEQLWQRLRHPVRVLQPPCAVIPAAPHLERRMLVQQQDIYEVLMGSSRG